MARATDGVTGSAIGKPARAAGGERSAQRAAKPARRVPRVWATSMQFLRDVLAEMDRVTWPDRPTLIASSLVVVFVLVVTSMYLAGCDLIFAKIFAQLFQ
jgi:preprotein translocase subunit SecE